MKRFTTQSVGATVLKGMVLAVGLFMATVSSAFAATSTSADTLVRFNGEHREDNAGFSITPAGDTNGDGFDDFLVGAPNAEVENGRVYLFFGSQDLYTHAVNLEEADVVFTGETADTYAGYSLSAGDVNNDGINDVVIGTPYANGNTGAVYVVFGGAFDSSYQLPSDADVVLTGNVAGDLFAKSLTVGDVNGDSVHDIVVGAPEAGLGGEVYVFGGGSSLGGGTASAAALRTYTTTQADSNFGYSVAVANVNAAGTNDLLIGSPYYNNGVDTVGALYVVPGNTFASRSTMVSSRNALVLEGEETLDFAGYAVASLGDVNGDGMDDAMVSAPFNDESAVNAGKVYVLLGNAALRNGVRSLSTTPVQYTGEAANDRMGQSIAAGGDLNNDGYNDMLFGAHRSDASATNAGRAYIMLGQDTLVSRNLSSADLIFDGETEEDFFGLSVATAGDTNNDGLDELLVSAEVNDTAGFGTGAVYMGYIYDNVAPVVTPETNPETGDTTVILECRANYADLGATAWDNLDGELMVDVDSASVDGDTVGTYSVVYSATDARGNTGSATRTVVVQDTVAPQVFLVGENVVTVEYGNTYTERGVDVVEECGDYTVEMTGVVNTSTLGTTVVTYTVTDTAGNSTTVERTVHVVDTTAPVITVNGDTGVSVTQGDEYADAGATAVDNVDGELAVMVDNPVDPSTPGTYTVTYVATDSSGNVATATRTVVVVEPEVVTETVTETVEVEVPGDTVVETVTETITERIVETVEVEVPVETVLRSQALINCGTHQIARVERYRAGKIKLTTTNGRAIYYTIFNTPNATRRTRVEPVGQADTLVVTAPQGKKLAMVNACTGEVVKTKRIGRKKYKVGELKVVRLHGKYVAVVTARRGNTGRMTTLVVKPKKGKFGRRQTRKMNVDFQFLHVRVQRDIKKISFVNSETNERVKEFLFTKKAKLKKYPETAAQ